MALRSIDNTVPTKFERPKKVVKLTPPSVSSKLSNLPCPGTENTLTPESKPGASDPLPSEYIASKDLKPLAVPETKIKGLLEELEAKDWNKVCEGLNDVRRLAIHHSTLLLPIMENVMLVMVKALKNPRSALCKTAIMASTDIFCSFGHSLLYEETKALDNLLLHLLLKASQDKRFVCEEAEKALETLARFATPLPLLKKLRSYVNHANPRVRAKAAVTFSKCITNSDVETMKEFGLVALLQIAAELLNDRLPEAREAARMMINNIHSGFCEENHKKEEEEDKEEEDMEKIHSGFGEEKLKKEDVIAKSSETWESFCSSNLPSISAQSIIKIVLQY